MTTLKKWRELKELVQDSVDSVSRMVERVQKDTTKRWFDAAEGVPTVAGPVRVVRAIHDTSVAGVHEIIRFANQVAGAVADGVIDALEKVEAKKASRGPQTEGSTPADGTREPRDAPEDASTPAEPPPA